MPAKQPITPNVQKPPTPLVTSRSLAATSARYTAQAVAGVTGRGAMGSIAVDPITAAWLNPEVSQQLRDRFFSLGNTMTAYAPQFSGARTYGLPASIGGEQGNPARVLGTMSGGPLALQASGSSGSALRGSLGHEWYHVYQNLQPVVRTALQGQILARVAVGQDAATAANAVLEPQAFGARRELPFGIPYGQRESLRSQIAAADLRQRGYFR